MKFAEILAGLVLTAVVLYYLFNSNSASTINAIGTQSSGFVTALMGRG